MKTVICNLCGKSDNDAHYDNDDVDNAFDEEGVGDLF
jgi:hypothetical protein